MLEILKLKEEATQLLLDKFRIAPEKSSLTVYTPTRWIDFIIKNELNPASIGAYYNGDHSAHIKYQPKTSNIILFHEYFGHGLHAEHTKLGWLKHEISKKLEQEEKEASITTPENRAIFRQTNPASIELDILNKYTAEHCEGFATWMEWWLSRETGNEAIFRELLEKYNQYKDTLKKLVGYSTENGEHALLYSCGLPKYYDTKTLEGMLRTMYLWDFKSIDFALVFGSRKPYSDIDILLVSDKITDRNNSWLDLSAVSREKLEELAAKLDLSITDPLFTGEFICGSRNMLEKTKKRILEAQITQDMIDYHRQHAEKAKQTGLSSKEGTKDRQTALRYNKSYLANAKELEQGRKPLTLKELAKKHPEELTS